ncbi:hypothetical protein BKH43_08280 [Helicobacter sp. 13S00401-1]|uniref:type II toxin-antitoxin system RelE family toxin n=1 Tax=Helicobacter sp. 13S00401-1 TaxID=1905758 RepID=UPI000BA51C7B|nr:type II toxin-antitoxin system RelE/ParE family toxin [Helicobacter sp. 13S00401-1]PAF47028.1 hypothetical protein BKH43_08280 [Helicobacter sp. 13S00401-1]
MQVILTKKADKEFTKILRSDKRNGLRIQNFMDEVLKTSDNPTLLINCKKLQNAVNTWRWRVGEYRIVGIVLNEILTIEIIKISTRQDVY